MGLGMMEGGAVCLVQAGYGLHYDGRAGVCARDGISGHGFAGADEGCEGGWDSVVGEGRCCG